MQSCKNQSPVSPQVNQRSNLSKSVSVNKKTDNKLLVKGNTLHQIFESSKFVFKISSTLETLYRYDRKNNTEMVILKRIRNESPKFEKNRCLKRKKLSGNTRKFCDKIYDVYELISPEKRRVGYMFCSRQFYANHQTVEEMYFALKKYEKKEGEF